MVIVSSEKLSFAAGGIDRFGVPAPGKGVVVFDLSFQHAGFGMQVAIGPKLVDIFHIAVDRIIDRKCTVGLTFGGQKVVAVTAHVFLLTPAHFPVFKSFSFLRIPDRIGEAIGKHNYFPVQDLRTVFSIVGWL
ncbi:MAG: hypothetical protein K0S33_2837 [Bacteroidetes bacterium]|nr:hypothetical protein [Bacteroidota bacterium]